MKYGTFEQIKTSRLLLRKLRSTDVECYYKRLGGSEEVTRYMLWQPHQSPQESRESIEKILSRYQEKTCYCWAITRLEDDSVIGRIDLLRFDEQDKSCSFAYMLGKEFWNCGFGTEALKAVFSFAFEKLEIQRIVADHMRENIASGKVMEKAGMRYVKTHLSKYEKNGIHYDADEYVITLGQWKEVSGKCDHCNIDSFGVQYC